MRLLALTVLSACSVVLGCSLQRAPIVDRPTMDAGRDAPLPGIDAPGEDVPFVEPDVPPPPSDVPDPCLSCPDGTACMSTEVCVCDATLCGTIGECSGVDCVRCGGIDERCCASDRCRAGTVCSFGMCIAAVDECGRSGLACCDGVNCLGPTECIGGTCVDSGGGCGGPGEDCCGGGACIAGHSCQWDGGFGAECRACGGRGQPCCPFGPECSSGSCMGLVFRRCG